MRFVLLLIAIISLSACTSQTQSNTQPNQQVTQSKIPALENPKATPMPFQEMTVPYLRERQYTSSLSELKKNSETSTYTSYLTSYNSDGLKINAQLTEPKGAKPANGWPAIVFVHGYIPPNQYQTLSKYVEYVDNLARNGFVVLKIDLRGHGNSEGQAGGGYYSSDYVIDTLNARAALQSADFVNKDAVGLWGHSMAGNVTSRALAARPEILAVVIWAGAGFTYSDLQEYRISDNSYRPQPSSTQTQSRRQLLFDTHGQFNPDNEFWKQVPATNYLSDITGAIQLHHAQDDNVVSIKYSENLNKLLDQTTIDHSFYKYNSGGHNISGSSFSQAMKRTVEFYKSKLSI
jgi:dipeptidyl aminopeptidase/acylaminoacyl peptidase